MNPKFLASATGCITGLLPEVKNGKKGIVGGRGKGNLPFVMNHSFELVGFEGSVENALRAVPKALWLDLQMQNRTETDMVPALEEHAV